MEEEDCEDTSLPPPPLGEEAGDVGKDEDKEPPGEEADDDEELVSGEVRKISSICKILWT